MPNKKATLHKLFILDPKGEYQGEMPIDETCELDYTEVLEILDGRTLEDGQSIFVGEWKVTAIGGARMGLVAVSRGSLGSEEITWARFALHCAEATLGADAKPAEKPAPKPSPPAKAAPDATARDVRATSLDAREAELKRREEALRAMEENTRKSVDEFRRNTEMQLEDLRAQLAAARQQSERDRKTIAPVTAPRDGGRAEPRGFGSSARPSYGVPVGREAEDVRAEIDREKMLLQKRAIEFLEREERLRDRETKAEEDGHRLRQAREEIERLRTEVETAKAAPPPVAFDQAAAKREIDQRVMILQQKASDLIAREEALKKRAEEVEALLRRNS